LTAGATRLFSDDTLFITDADDTLIVGGTDAISNEVGVFYFEPLAMLSPTLTRLLLFVYAVFLYVIDSIPKRIPLLRRV
jgi:hypothetical protein